MKISIIIPVYNVELYLKECIDSILMQSFKDFELILVDDGSRDNSLKICEEYAKIDNRVRVIHKENGGPVSACNVGLNVSFGEYIAFIDSDDFVEYDYLQSFVDSLQCNTDIIFMNCIRYVKENQIQLYKTNNLPAGKYNVDCELLSRVIDSTNGKLSITRWAKLIRSDIAKKAASLCSEEVVMGDDYQFFVALMLNSKLIEVIDKYKYYHRDNQFSLVNNYKIQYWERTKLLFNTVDNIPGVDKIGNFKQQTNAVFLEYICACLENEYNYGKLNKKYFLDLLNYDRTQSALKSHIREEYKYKKNKLLIDALNKKSFMKVKVTFLLCKIYRRIKLRKNNKNG